MEIVAIGAALLAIGISACASSGTGIPSPTPSTRANVSPSPSPSPSGPKVYAVGKAMTNGAHQTVTVTAFTQGVAASAYSTPSAGDQCVSVQVALFNGDSSPWELPLYELTAVDASGQSYDSYSSLDCPSSDSIDSLVPGGHAAATLYFEVPGGSSCSGRPAHSTPTASTTLNSRRRENDPEATHRMALVVPIAAVIARARISGCWGSWSSLSGARDGSASTATSACTLLKHHGDGEAAPQ